MTSANHIQHGGSHYKKGGKFQHWDLIAQNGIGYLEGCATKYACRWKDKAGMLDLDKAGHYLDKILECVADYDYTPSGIAPMSNLLVFQDANDLGPDEFCFLTILCSWSTVEDLEQAKPVLYRLKREAERLGL